MSSSTIAATEESSVGGFKETVRKLLDAARSPLGRKIRFAIRFLLSFISVLYLVGIVKCAYYSTLYTLEIPDAAMRAFGTKFAFTCAGYALVMLITRKQVLTRFSIMLSMPFHLFIFIFNYQYRVIIIPLAVLVLLTYFCSGVGEGPKTILGAVYVMIYIIGAYLYMTAGTLLTTSALREVVESGTSTLGNYRYSVVQVTDKSDGSTYLSIEPNTLDVEKDGCILRIKGYDHQVYVVRPKTEFECEWTTATRDEIRQQILKANPDASYTLNAEQLVMLGIADSYKATIPVSETTKYQRQQLGICIAKDIPEGETAESIGRVLYTSDDEVTLDFETIRSAGLEISYNAKLKELSDADLEALGVPAESDVLTINGKVVFRQFVAVLENQFAGFSGDVEDFFQ